MLRCLGSSLCVILIAYSGLCHTCSRSFCQGDSTCLLEIIFLYEPGVWIYNGNASYQFL